MRDQVGLPERRDLQVAVEDRDPKEHPDPQDQQGPRALKDQLDLPDQAALREDLDSPVHQEARVLKEPLGV